VESHRHAVGHCYRCNTVIEPRLSDQWFVRMAPLARPALERYRDGTLQFIPERRGEDYARWLEGIRDWCISRQLWWGHRIPVWYCEDEGCARLSVSRTDLAACPGCGGPVRQDEDVLDTWFSSWLVPFTSLGWPESTRDLAAYYPGHTLVSAPEILFFWVARMIMSGLYVMGEVPYTRIYLHGTVRDTQHRKMSKSLGNGIDPLEVVRRYGADALRYSLVTGMSVGTDLILDPDDFESSFGPGRNFANKLWNAGRFILSNLDSTPRPLGGRALNLVRREELTLADRWIIARCDATVREATESYERFRLNEAAAAVYRFIWSDLADWYIEQIKPRLYGDVPGGDVARAVAAQTFDVALRLLHPVMPFITEALWRRFPGRPADASISVAPWPRPDARAEDAAALREFGLVQEVVSAIRGIRAEYGVQPGQAVRAVVSRPDTGDGALHRERLTVSRLAKVSDLSFGEPSERVGGHAVLSDGTAVFVPLGDAIDVSRECQRLSGEMQRLTQLVESQDRKLGNQQFVSRAPADVVQREREKAATWREQREVLSRKLELLGCGA
jgi:valyl-tRNA synthetase